ncbi:MAG TPA: cyclopropane-fatty-acyl-phospholipid synthase family protein [Candidatus Binatia bacterium]|nr:cyclopropane-fatty-acyl-phospholipid synthase family protein [Candidatus Binatia bacterium]
MSPTTTSGTDRKLLAALRRKLGPLPIALVLRDTRDVPETSEPIVATVRFQDRPALLSLAKDPDRGFGEAYSAGRVEVDGDLVRSLECVYLSRSGISRWRKFLLGKWLDWLQNNTRRGSRTNIHHHYDLSNDFYRLWLDERMLYTCAYFPTLEASLEAAQEAKMEMVCRKLRLRPGETVVETGCGWGALAIYMAQHYGVRVKAFNISHEQITYAREWAKREGLTGKVEFIEDDYRNLSDKFDVFCSVGMLEHVGRNHYHEFSRVIRRAIGDTGRGFLHYIGRNSARPLNAWIRERIFPGGYPPSLRESMDVFEPQNFSVLDVENLRMHYAKTLEHWLARFESSFDTVVRMKGLEFARAWRLYLCGSVAAFRTGSLQLFQVLFAGSRSPFIVWTREHLYIPFEEDTDRELWTRAM